MAKISATITVTAVGANAPPQYTGPAVINDLVVGVGRQLQAFDPDGDAIIWSVAPNTTGVSLTPGGILTASGPLSSQIITVFLDDGKP